MKSRAGSEVATFPPPLSLTQALSEERRGREKVLGPDPRAFACSSWLLLHSAPILMAWKGASCIATICFHIILVTGFLTCTVTGSTILRSFVSATSESFDHHTSLQLGFDRCWSL